MNYSLIIPIYNEEKTLKTLIEQLKYFSQFVEVIIINDGSCDQTETILKKQKRFKVLHNTTNKGKGYSILKGVKNASNENIILMDGDLEVHLDCINQLIEKYESSGYHVINGNRWNNKLKTKKNLNNYGNNFFNQIFNLLYDTQLKDILCCAKVLNKQLFHSLKLNSRGFSIEVEIMSKLALSGVKISEINVPYKRRSNAQGKKLKISDGWEILFKMIKIRFAGNKN